MNIRKIVIKKSKKSFTLDPGLGHLKDQSVPGVMAKNWDLLMVELKKFGVKLNKSVVAEVIAQNPETMENII